MPFAYDLFTQQHKSNIDRIVLNTYDNKIEFQLQCEADGCLPEISYEKNGLATLITFEQKEIDVSQNFLDVFLEDLKMVLMNQKTVLEFLQVSSEGTGISTEKCFFRLNEILKARTSPIAVKRVYFTEITVSQGMSIIRYLNPDVLSHLHFSYPPEPASFEGFLNGFKCLEGDYRFILWIIVEKIGKDDVMVINEFSSFSKFFRNLTIFPDILEHEDEWRANLSDDFKLIKTHKCFIENGTNHMCGGTNESVQKEKTPVISDVCEITARTVLENPLPMELILKQLECFDIERLRKVNIGIRECIDAIKPDPHIEKYYFFFDFTYGGCYQIDAHVQLESGKSKEIRYWRDINRSQHPRKKCEFFYQNYQENFGADGCVYLCLNDFETSLRHQNSCMEELSIFYKWHVFEASYEELSKYFGEVLRRREHPLKTKKFSMEFNSQMEVMGILPAIDRNSLKIIELLRPCKRKDKYIGFEEPPIEVEQLSQTDQWNNAEKLVSELTITTPIEKMNIMHFSKLEILVKTLSSQDVNYLKTNLLNSPTFQKFKISFWESAIDESLHELIGEPYRNFSDVKKVWYFRIQNTDYYIHMVLDTRDVEEEEGEEDEEDVKLKEVKLKPKLVIFKRVAKENTPFFELPIDQLAIH
ncbi:hypothetical protein B9Z55_021255 [Caenorhabditis nigoni]|uniref:DUF38 domain-containing protein n=1 Tax=Caenorhabditis nigoni TaxID=1611254 RepID=A0A2G5TRR9_9PELO|nr:hypothetical protein B9Z55_021255 [Caenorhabditis nigoni]